MLGRSCQPIKRNTAETLPSQRIAPALGNSLPSSCIKRTGAESDSRRILTKEVTMDHGSAREILRLDRLVDAAQRHQDIARHIVNTHREVRGAALEMAVNRRAVNIVLDNVSPYRE
jgi:hypothetical protein